MSSAPVTSYKIVTEPTPEELAAAVNHWIKHGWEPLGGMVVTKDEFTGSKYHQSMIYRSYV